MTQFDVFFVFLFLNDYDHVSDWRWWHTPKYISKCCRSWFFFSVENCTKNFFIASCVWEPFFPLFSPLIAIPYELEIFPLNMLNGAISNFTSSKDFLIRSSVRPVGPKTWCSHWLGVNESKRAPRFGTYRPNGWS